MSIPPNFSIVTLGVADLERSAAFYRMLGWEQRGDQTAGITWFRTSGTWIGLFGYDELAADVGLPADPPTDYRGVTLALNFGSAEDVDAAFLPPSTPGHGRSNRPSAPTGVAIPATSPTRTGICGRSPSPPASRWRTTARLRSAPKRQPHLVVRESLGVVGAPLADT